MCNLLQFSQAALEAKINDGDYRTYMVLCSLAADNHQERGYFTVELTYAEIGESHPKPLSAAGVRSRINRLAKAGLVTRQRINSRRWRTIPTGDNSAFTHNGAARENPQIISADSTQPVAALPVTAPNPSGDVSHNTHAAQPLPSTTPTAVSDVTQNPQTAAIHNTQPASAWQESTPTEPPAPGDNTQSLVGVTTERTQPTVNDTKYGTQVSLTVVDEETQDDVHVLYAEGQILVFDMAMKLLGRKVDKFVSTEPFSEEENVGISERAYLNRSIARRRLIRTAIERADAFLNGESIEDGVAEVVEEVGVVSQNAPSMINDHDDLNNSSIHDHAQEESNSNKVDLMDTTSGGHESMLATVLANLPQPMSPDGIVECTAEPALCAAWLDYATNPNAGVRNPAAYVRKGVRSGKYPPPISKTYISPNSPIYKPSYSEMLNAQTATN